VQDVRREADLSPLQHVFNPVVVSNPSIESAAPFHIGPQPSGYQGQGTENWSVNIQH
jgi:hypothetical protein